VMCHVESHFGPFGDRVSVSARLVHGLRQTYHMLRNHFGHTQVVACFVPFGDSTNFDTR
jgi:hypothetical protein